MFRPTGTCQEIVFDPIPDPFPPIAPPKLNYTPGGKTIGTVNKKGKMLVMNDKI
jgi:hypothetical protein